MRLEEEYRERGHHHHRDERLLSSLLPIANIIAFNFAVRVTPVNTL
jgi:hypothetical protein